MKSLCFCFLMLCFLKPGTQVIRYSHMCTHAHTHTHTHTRTLAHTHTHTAGCSNEIYRARLSPMFTGMRFDALADICYMELNCTVFAMEIVDASGMLRIVLNPARFEVPPGQHYVYLLAKDQDASFCVTTYGTNELIKRNMQALREEAAASVVQQHSANAAFSRNAARPTTKGAAVGGAHNHAACERSEQRRERLRKAFHYLDEPITYEEMHKESVEYMQGHTIVTGDISSVCVCIYMHTCALAHTHTHTHT
jgi:hypothetical protein